jgi:peptidyl-prolyl cis-trans isomerase C
MISNRTRNSRLPALCVSMLLTALLAPACRSDASPASESAPSAQKTPATGATAQPADTAKSAAATSPTANAQQNAPQTVDVSKLPDVVATVNGENVTRDDLVQTARGAQQRLRQAGHGAPPATTDFYNQILDQLIGTTLLYQESQAAGTAASDEDAQQQVAALEKRVNNPDTFNQLLQRQQMTRQELQETLKEDLSIQNYVQQKIAPTVQVSDAEAKAFYDKNSDKMKHPERVQVSHILIRVPKDATDEQKATAKKKAEDLLQQIKGGADFAQLATANSDDPGSKARGGALGWIQRGQTVKPFEDAAFALKPQQVSGVVESPFGYHIIKQTDHEAAGTTTFDEAEGQIKNFLTQQKVQAAVRAKVQELIGKAKIQRFI